MSSCTAVQSVYGMRMRMDYYNRMKKSHCFLEKKCLGNQHLLPKMLPFSHSRHFHLNAGVCLKTQIFTFSQATLPLKSAGKQSTRLQQHAINSGYNLHEY